MTGRNCFEVTTTQMDGSEKKLPLRGKNEKEVWQKAKHIAGVRSVGAVRSISFNEYTRQKNEAKPREPLVAGIIQGPKIVRPAKAMGAVERPFAGLVLNGK